MGIIHVLPEKVANKIAAGEVIERPASIVKELVENSLDAGATSIEVAIGHGGKSFIAVADDGCGMSPEDAELAFKPHATSKILSAEDLLRIESFGFRGEALPSLAAVARVKMTTRSGREIHGTEVVIEGGSLVSAKEAPRAQGTTVEVRDLFFNTPARRKFLKSDATEMGHVLDVVAHIALAKLSVHFVLKQDNHVIFDLAPGETLIERARKVLGEETAKGLLALDRELNGVRIRGLVGKPYLVRSNRSAQIFFVNDRWVRSFAFGYALQAAYHGWIMQGQFPVAVLFLDLDSERVDVNVHPTKQEVRLSQESVVKSLIQETVRACLEKEKDLAPQGHAPFGGSSGLDFSSVPQRAVADFSSLAGSQVQKTFQAEEPIYLPPSETAATLSEPLVVGKLSITKILGQVHHTFIVAETEEGLIVVDQHAAHERIMFEELMQNFKSGHAASQSLLMDEVLDLHPKYREVLTDALKMLHQIGFELEEFGENAFVIRAYPAVFGDQNPVIALKNFLEEVEDGKLDTKLGAQSENVAALVACKRKSVKAFEALSPQSMRALLERLAKCENPFNCPHGRPTFFKQSFDDLEKQFKRK